MRLNKRLTLINVVMLTTGALVVAFATIYSLKYLASAIEHDAASTLHDETFKRLEAQSRSIADAILAQVKVVERDTVKLSNSANLLDFSKQRLGRSAEATEIRQRRAMESVEAILSSIRTQGPLLEGKLKADLRTARFVLDSKGGLQLTPEQVEWPSTNQFSPEQKGKVLLPKIKIGNQQLVYERSLEVKAPVVDDVTVLTGSLCTIFQRMNEAGDMLRVATTVRAKDGLRGIGTYIPTRMADGKMNAVLQKVVAEGTPYVGRALVVNTWCLTAYEPIVDMNKKIVGMLFVGIPEQDNQEIARIIAETKIGSLGYPFVLSSTGDIILHPDKARIGQNVIRDLNLKAFEPILAGKDAEGMVNYELEGKRKFVAFRRYAPWEWLICGSGYWDELNSVNAADSRARIEQEMLALDKNSVLHVGEKKLPLYAQMRYLEEDGAEILKDQGQQIRSDLGSRKGVAWFDEARKLSPGEVSFSEIELAKNTGKPELRMSTPVLFDKERHGVVTINLNWSAIEEIVRSQVVGRTGVSMILNHRGKPVAHPKFSLQDGKDFVKPEDAGPSLAAGVNTMLKQEKPGMLDFEEAGRRRTAAYYPFAIGGFRYYAMTTMEEDEFLDVARKVKVRSAEILNSAIRAIAALTLGLLVIGGFIAWLLARRISAPIMAGVQLLTEVSAKGDLTKEVDPQALQQQDEVGELSRAMQAELNFQRHQERVACSLADGDWNQSVQVRSERDLFGQSFARMVAQVNEALSEIQDMSQQVNNHAAGVMNASQSLSQEATEQAAAIEQISATLTEIASQARSNVQVAETAKTHASGAQEAALRGQGHILEMGQAMNEISMGSSQIAKIIKLIDEIAFQTNLLALNAAVEAARAGRHGKGFAVVAEEVRNLASRSAKAASETAELIENATEKVRKGNEIVGLTSEVLEEIVAGVSQTAELMQGIVTASREQAAGVEQSNKGVNQLETVAQHGTANAEEMAASAIELNSLAQRFKELLSRFRLRNQTGRAELPG